jgi:hypothetical protein
MDRNQRRKYRSWQHRRTIGQPMTIKFFNTFGDRAAFALYALPRNPFNAAIMIGTFVLFSWIVLRPAVPPNHSVAHQTLTFILAEIFVAALILVFWVGLVFVATLFNRNKLHQVERTVILKDELLIIETEFGKSEIKWNAIQRLGRIRKHLFLCLGKDSGIVIPSRAFEKPSQWEEFYEFCKGKTDLKK